MQPSYTHGTTAATLLGETLGEALDSAARRFGPRDALISCHQNLRYSYAELLREANRAAKALLALGVQRGDRVGIWSSNNAEWMITQYAAAKAGAILVNVNPAFRIRELQHVLKHSGVTVLVSGRGFRGADYVQMLAELAPALPALRHVVYLGDSDLPAGVIWSDFLTLGDGVSDNELGRREALLQFDENIYPREIEELLHTHPKITQAYIIGVPDPHYGEQVCAWVALRDGETVTADHVQEFCKGQISGYKIPRYVRFTNEFPMTVTGKIQKFRMREISIEELGLSRTAKDAAM